MLCSLFIHEANMLSFKVFWPSVLIWRQDFALSFLTAPGVQQHQTHLSAPSPM